MPEWRVTVCNGPTCGAKIVFLKTARGSIMPINYDEATVSALDTHYVHGRHVPHHSTCPDVDYFRKKRKPKRGR